MPNKHVSAISGWIKNMGFKLVKSHFTQGTSVKFNYYNLGNFSICEEVATGVRSAEKSFRFISWTPWGDDFEVNSVNDLSKAYQDSISYSPAVRLI